MEISGLEDEFQLSQAFPRLMYVKVPAPDREPRLTEMLARIEAEGSVSYRHLDDAIAPSTSILRRTTSNGSRRLSARIP
jgi:hypothetical protein